MTLTALNSTLTYKLGSFLAVTPHSDPTLSGKVTRHFQNLAYPREHKDHSAELWSQLREQAPLSSTGQDKSPKHPTLEIQNLSTM